MDDIDFLEPLKIEISKEATKEYAKAKMISEELRNRRKLTSLCNNHDYKHSLEMALKVNPREWNNIPLCLQQALEYIVCYLKHQDHINAIYDREVSELVDISTLIHLYYD